jgi:mono/diheme cytochrome c family protein
VKGHRGSDMKNLKPPVAWIFAILCLAVATAAQQVAIKLPGDNAASEIKVAPGQETVRKNCIICHSTDYIVRQPHLDARHWADEVDKMIRVYGARISEADRKVIADYLAKNYGSDNKEGEQKLGAGKQ